eukprot:COSAG01_NODE_28158_length_667_cov_6.033451_1_plen_159_part_01
MHVEDGWVWGCYRRYERRHRLAARVVQRWWRGLLATRAAVVHLLTQRAAAVCIQCAGRRWLARLALTRARSFKVHSAAAVVIQAGLRGWVGRRACVARRRQLEERARAVHRAEQRRRSEAAVLIQRRWRGYACRRRQRDWLTFRRARAERRRQEAAAAA